MGYDSSLSNIGRAIAANGRIASDEPKRISQTGRHPCSQPYAICPSGWEHVATEVTKAITLPVMDSGVLNWMVGNAMRFRKSTATIPIAKQPVSTSSRVHASTDIMNEMAGGRIRRPSMHSERGMPGP